MSTTRLNLSKLSDITDGTHTVKVKAKADGYRDSEFSNEVSYTKISGYTIRFDSNFIEASTYEPAYAKVNTPPNNNDDYTACTTPFPGVSGTSEVSGVTKLFVWGYGYKNSAGERVLLNNSTYSNAVEIPVSSDGIFYLVGKGDDY